MTTFEICYLEDDGTLACAFSVQFEDEMRAKILAHAMKPTAVRTIEVWHGQQLVYRRPDDTLDVRRLVPVARAAQERLGAA